MPKINDSKNRAPRDTLNIKKRISEELFISKMAALYKGQNRIKIRLIMKRLVYIIQKNSKKTDARHWLLTSVGMRHLVPAKSRNEINENVKEFWNINVKNITIKLTCFKLMYLSCKIYQGWNLNHLYKAFQKLYQLTSKCGCRLKKELLFSEYWKYCLYPKVQI